MTYCQEGRAVLDDFAVRGTVLLYFRKHKSPRARSTGGFVDRGEPIDQLPGAHRFLQHNPPGRRPRVDRRRCVSPTWPVSRIVVRSLAPSHLADQIGPVMPGMVKSVINASIACCWSM